MVTIVRKMIAGMFDCFSLSQRQFQLFAAFMLIQLFKEVFFVFVTPEIFWLSKTYVLPQGRSLVGRVGNCPLTFAAHSNYFKSCPPTLQQLPTPLHLYGIRQYWLECPQNALSSIITKEFTFGTTFSHFMDQKHYRKLKIEFFHPFLNPAQAIQSFST